MTIYSKLSYLEKHRFAERQIHTTPAQDLGMVIVIPCHNEEDLLGTLDSLEACQAPRKAVEVIVLINAGSKHEAAIHDQNARTLADATLWLQASNRQFSYYFLLQADLPPKHAGVGLARKIGMDEAVDRLEQVENAEGVIICLDADSRVQSNYLREIEAHVAKFPATEAVSIAFAHPTSGDVFPPAVYDGIIQYELFLRYYIEALRWAGYPHAYHTIGSSMAVRSSAYQKRGGMNRRKAGEDFYFLHKFIQEGTLTELTRTTVIPSPRPSDRVPFGTGRSISQWLAGDQSAYHGYSWTTFVELKAFLQQIPQAYSDTPNQFPPMITAFLEEEKWPQKLAELRHHVASHKGFVKRFYHWFDGLKVLKFVHYARDHGYQSPHLLEGCQELLHARAIPLPSKQQASSYLEIFRTMQQNKGGRNPKKTHH
ncbi:MAG: glycosyltransferase family 2 protein [Bacteroidota bacterium]